MNKLQPEDIEWRMSSSYSGNWNHRSLFRDDKLGVQMEKYQKVNDAGSIGKPKIYYFIDDCEKEMTDIDDLCKTWSELKNFDDPNNEIVWEKKIVKTIKLNPK